MIKIALIGCTGSIGRQVLDVVRRHKQQFSVTALVAGSNAEALAALAEEFRPRIAVCASQPHSERAQRASESHSEGNRVTASRNEIHSGFALGMREDLFSDCDAAFIAASGFAGLAYTLAAIEAGKRVLLANKESLVCGGELVMRAAQERGVEIVPVDSEHSAIFQALHFNRRERFERLVLTASGGPFLHFTKEQLARVTAADALNHPTWNMGPKVTVDSATLLNKGYEVIEAKWLYGADFERIEAVVHPESIVHSLVYFEDGAALAQLGYPDMRVPIQLALTYPERLPCEKPLDLIKLGALHFERLPEENFPCFTLALKAGRAGGTAPTILNAAAETAVRAFLAGSITFPQIAETIQDALSRIPNGAATSFAALEEADRLARTAAQSFIYGK